MSRLPPISTIESPFDAMLQRTRSASPALFCVATASLLASVLTLAVMWADPRTPQGASVWLKPWKFQFSFGIYALTLTLFMVWLPAPALRTRAVRFVVWAAIVSGLFEVIYITWQGARGLPSHFYRTDRFYAVMYTLMGVGAVVLTSSALVLGIVIARERAYALAPAIKLSIVLGLVLTFVLGAGFGGYLGGQASGHWVGGVKSDAGGLPIVGWARGGGDLRVAHFFGIHAMHFVPAFAAAWSAVSLPNRGARAAVWAFALVFSGVRVFTFVQAVQGRPFLG